MDCGLAPGHVSERELGLHKGTQEEEMSFKDPESLDWSERLSSSLLAFGVETMAL